MAILVGGFYLRHDPAEAARAKAWYDDAREAYLREGYPPYRATSMRMTGAMDSNPVARDLLAAIKGAVDLHNLVAPGRHGVQAPPADLHNRPSLRHLRNLP